MSLHLGHYIGLNLIKTALKTNENSLDSFGKGSLSEGSDSEKRRISEMFDSIPNLDKMPPESMGKTGAEANFRDNIRVPANWSEVDKKKRRGVVDKNENEKPSETAWREHDSYAPQSDDGMSIEHSFEPGPF